MVATKVYLTHLTRGSELLRAEKLEEARDELEKAIALKPGDGRIMNLLGLTYFRLGHYPEAQAIYVDLVKRQPQDGSLHLNLGLVHLKRGDIDDAIRELTRARELDPSNLRTMGYLGLAFARKGRYALARDSFYAAGQDELAKEMDIQLSAEISQVARLPVNGSSRPVEAAPAASPTDPAPPASPGPTAPGPAQTAPTEPGIRLDGPPPAEPGPAPERLDVFARRRLIRPEARALPFEVSGGALVVRVRGRVLARTDATLASGGQLSYAPATRRARGRVSADAFSGGGISFVTGDGHLVAHARGGAFATLQLAGDSLYLREELVFAFEDRLSWENGHVPGSGGALPVLQLRGEGCIALRATRPLIGIEIRAPRPLIVDSAALAGWTGDVVPRLAGSVVELAGDGTVFVEEPR